MLTVADFRRALDKAPELRYVDQAWSVYDNYVLEEGHLGAYVYAPESPVVEGPEGTDRLYETPHPARDAGPEEELWEDLQEYFLQRFRGAAEEEFKNFMAGFLLRLDDAVDEARTRRLREWFSTEHTKLDEPIVDRLHDLAAEAFDDVDEYTADLLFRLHGETIEAFHAGGRERMFELLCKACEGVNEQDLDLLFANMRKDLDGGAGIVEALGRVVSADEAGGATPGPFLRGVLLKKKQEVLTKFRGTLDEAIDYKNSHRPFYPLSSPRIFLDFAKLGGKQITQDVVMRWVHDHGILGLGSKGPIGDAQSRCFGGPQETVAAFAREAKEAHLLKRTYEAALLMDNEDIEVVEGAIQELREIFGWSEHHRPSPPECKEKALEAVKLQIQSQLDNHCFTKWRRAGNGLVEFLQFRTVVGAMYLQFAWVLRERSDVRRCRYCGKPVDKGQDAESGQSPEAKRRKIYKNKEFCADRCRDDYKNERRRRQREEDSLKFSVPPATKKEVETLAAMRAMDVDALFREMLQLYKDHNQAGEPA